MEFIPPSLMKKYSPTQLFEQKYLWINILILEIKVM